MTNFSSYTTFVFDLDGTIWDKVRIFPGVAKTFARLRRAGKKILIISNHTLSGRKQISAELRKMGLQVSYKEIINSGYAIALWLKKKNVKKVLAFGYGVKEDLGAQGIKTTDKLPVKYVVLGHDEEMNYKKLGKIYEAVLRGATVISSAPGRLFFVGDKSYPGMGAFNAAIEYMTKKRVVILGKPSEWMLNLVKKIARGKTVIFGDEIDSDVPFGKKAGWTTVLVLTGVDKSAKVEKGAKGGEKSAKREMKPDYILKSVADIKL